MSTQPVARDVRPTEGAPSAAMTTTDEVSRCDRTFFHVPHETADGACPGYIEPGHLTPAELAEQVDRLRREATAYGYEAGYADAAAGRDYSNAWREDQS